MTKVTYIELVCSTYHDTPVIKIRYGTDDTVHESALYTPAEVNNILHLWQDDNLKGSFGVGTTLAKDFKFQLVES